MADNNPIKYKDLISPDNSIEELIKQLTELKDTYTDALASIKAEAIQLAATLQKVSGATEDGRKKTKKAADDADRLARAQKNWRLLKATPPKISGVEFGKAGSEPNK